MGFYLTTQTVNNHHLLVKLYGEASVFTAPALLDRLNAIIQAGNFNIIISLEKLFFLDSSGLSVFVAVHKLLKKYQRKLIIVCANQTLYQMFVLSWLYKLLKIVKNIQEANNYLNQNKPLSVRHLHQNEILLGDRNLSVNNNQVPLQALTSSG